METKRSLRFDESGNVRGLYLHLDIHKAPFYNQRGEMIGTVGLGRDITREVKTRLQTETSRRGQENVRKP